jgi:hypothetical protein
MVIQPSSTWSHIHTTSSYGHTYTWDMIEQPPNVLYTFNLETPHTPTPTQGQYSIILCPNSQCISEEINITHPTVDRLPISILTWDQEHILPVYQVLPR